MVFNIIIFWVHWAHAPAKNDQYKLGTFCLVPKIIIIWVLWSDTQYQLNKNKLGTLSWSSISGHNGLVVQINRINISWAHREDLLHQH